MRNLRLQRARIHNLAERSVGRQRQKVTRNVEGPRLQRALVRFLLHVGRFGSNVDQILRHVRRKRLVLGEQKIQCLAVETSPLIIRPEIRRVIPTLLEVLIPRRPLLPIPALLVGQFNRR